MNYTVKRRIGAGSFGVVHEIEDDRGIIYAAKSAGSDDPVASHLLECQFRFLSTLDHERIARVVDFDFIPPLGPTLVTEFVEGTDLHTYVEANGIEDLFPITLKVLDALRYLHDNGKLHGDLKPDSILIVDREGSPDVKLIDAGLGSEMGSEGDRTYGSAPKITGTLPYMAPEIIRNSGSDGRSDLYSLGAVLYEVLTGVRPFDGPTATEILKRHLEYEPPSPREVRPGVAPAWDTFVTGLLRKEPILRYADAAAAALELGKLFGKPAEFAMVALPPRSLAALGLEEEIAAVTGFVGRIATGNGPRALAVRGRTGSGVAEVMWLASLEARALGLRTYCVRLQAGMPALAQVIDALPKSSVSGDLPADPAAALAEIINALEVKDGTAGTLLALDAGDAAGDAAGDVAGDVADLGEVTALGRIARKVRGPSGVMIGYRVRSSSDEGSLDPRLFEIVELRDMDEDDVEVAIKRHFGVKALPEGLARQVMRATGGRRRFVEVALARLWKEVGLVYEVGQYGLEIVWDASIGVSGIAAIADEDALRRSLRDLTVACRQILALVCAAGGRLDLALCRRFMAMDDWAARLEELEVEGLVETTEDGKALVLIREDVRQVADARIPADWLPADWLPAGWLEGACVQVASMMEATRAEAGLLYLRGGKAADAFRLLVAAADRAARYSTSDAIAIYQKALACGVSPSEEAEIREKMGDARLTRGDLKEALGDFEAASGERPSSARKVGWVYGLRGDFDRAISLLSDCKRGAAASAEPWARDEKARVLLDLGYIYAMQGKREEALKSLGEAQRYFQAAGMALEAGVASNRIGILEMRSGNVRRAARAWEEAKASFERAGARRQVGMCLMTLGFCRWKEMDISQAMEYMERALAVFRETRALAEEARCLHNYSMVIADAGDLARARHLAREALDLNVLLGQVAGVAASRSLLASIELEAGNAAEAERIIEEISADGRKMTPFEQAVSTRYLAGAAAIRGKKDEALALIERSYDFAREAGDAEGEQQAILEKSRILLRFGQCREAARLAGGALAALSVSSHALSAAIAEATAGEALCLLGEIRPGMERLLAAKTSLQAIPESTHMARVMRALAAVCGRSGDWSSFEIYYRPAADIARKAGARYDFARALLEAGGAAGRRGTFIRARHYLAEAARILGSLGAEDLHSQAVAEMERVGPDDSEISAVTSLSKISQTLNSSFDLTTVLNLAMDLAMEYLGAERGVLMLEDGTKGRPATIIERKMDPDSVEEAITISRSIVEAVRRTREPVIASDATTDPRFMNSKSVRIHNVMSVMCVPLMRGDHLLGTIYLDNRDVPSEFTGLEKAFVGAFANQVALAIENARDVGKLYEDVSDLRAAAGKKYSFANIVGPGKAMQEVFRQVEKAAKSSIAVLLTGESGTGKELIAGLLHELGPRKGRPLVKVNCAAIHRDLLETELFGIEKAVATGIAPRSGFFERADGGTVFLDEIGDMPPTIQTKVLRVLAEKEFERVGGSKPIKVDVRVISATNQDLKALMKSGAFRNDLYYRLNGMRIHLPSLRERMEDLPVLVTHFVAKYAAENHRPPMHVTRGAWDVLKRYAWPGNVRELERCIEHAVVVADGVEIEARHMSGEIIESIASPGMTAVPASNLGLPQALRQTERDSIVKALREAKGVKTTAARNLGIHESTLRKKMKAFGLKCEDAE